MQFLHQPLTWAFFLVLLPLLIHLINMMRQKKVQWAAMEFLLKSYKKHRRWVWLKQLLLLLLRMVAVATLVAMLAKLVTKDEWTSFFSGRATHHYVLLDDSVSMGDRSGNTEVFDVARQAITQITARAAQQSTPQKMTLIRFSQASKSVNQTAVEAMDLADLNAEMITGSFEELLQNKGSSLQVSDLAVGPEAAVGLAESLIADAVDEKRILHVISDFRQPSAADLQQTKDALGRLENEGTEVRFVRCAQQRRANLALTELAPAEGTQAAGVPFFVNVKVKNLGEQTVPQVLVRIKTVTYAKAPDGSESPPQTDQLPDILINQLEPGQTALRQVQVAFAAPGQHVIEASLPPDALEADNRIWNVIDIPEGAPVLIVDSDLEQTGAYYLESVFRPGLRTNTGIMPTSQPLEFLRDASVDELAKFDSIYLVNIASLDEKSMENLNRYVTDGGGLGVFLGPDVNANAYTRWYDEGRGAFPLPLATDKELPLRTSGEPDVQFQDHPIFQVLLGERNPFARTIAVQRYFAPPLRWQPPEQSTVQMAARLRNGDPLVVEQRLGDGRVVAFLTTVNPEWNNWAREPSFVVVMLQMQSHLAAPLRDIAARYVGSPIQLQLPTDAFAQEVRFVPPQDTSLGAAAEIQVRAEMADDSPLMNFRLGIAGDSNQRSGETDVRGVYTMEAIELDGGEYRQRFALNVDHQESELALATDADIRAALAPLSPAILDADKLIYEDVADAGFSWTRILLFALLAFLLGEQLLAYSASYHPPRSVAATAGGLR
ncbi:MAG: BatA domain-containing protein [Pirellulaceae bacterium]